MNYSLVKAHCGIFLMSPLSFEVTLEMEMFICRKGHVKPLTLKWNAKKKKKLQARNIQSMIICPGV